MEADEIVTAEIDVQAYWGLIRRWLWAIVLAIVVAGTATYAVSAWIIPPVYQATVRLVVQPRSSLNAADYNDILAGQRAAATYAEMLQSLPLQEEALRWLGYSEAQLLQFGQRLADDGAADLQRTTELGLAGQLLIRLQFAGLYLGLD